MSKVFIVDDNGIIVEELIAYASYRSDKGITVKLTGFKANSSQMLKLYITTDTTAKWQGPVKVDAKGAAEVTLCEFSTTAPVEGGKKFDFTDATTYYFMVGDVFSGEFTAAK